MLSVCPVSLLKGEGIEFVRLKSRNSFGTPVLFSEVNYGCVAVIATKLLETQLIPSRRYFYDICPLRRYRIGGNGL
jgi:hypothetical protein